MEVQPWAVRVKLRVREPKARKAVQVGLVQMPRALLLVMAGRRQLLVHWQWLRRLPLAAALVYGGGRLAAKWAEARLQLVRWT